MHVNGGVRQFVKHSLSVARVRLLYERITLSRYTALYFVCATLTCFLLGSFQILGLLHDSEAVSALSTFIQKSNSTSGLAILKDNTIKLCSGLPNERGTICKPVISFENGFGEWQWNDLRFNKFVQENPSDIKHDLARSLKMRATVDKSGNKSQELDLDACYVSLKWLNDVLHDDQREDVITFLFQIWLFILSFVTIMNESIPHLGAALFGNMLSTAWAGYRVYSTYSLMSLYRSDISIKACNGRDLLGNWWEVRLSDTIPLVVCDGVASITLTFLSFKLYKVYDHQTSLRVGASSKVLRIYKLVLVFSVFLQLSGFISFASTGLWIDKVVHGSLAEFTSHTKLFLAEFVVILVILLPWLVFGWICVRKECNVRFTLFCLISLLLLGTSIAMFASDLYRYIFSTWPFFATITVTSFFFLVGAAILGVLCRLNFGQGLAHYIQVNETLEGVNFTPVYFTKPDVQDIEKSVSSDAVPKRQSLAPPRPFHPSQPRGDSVYSDLDAAPIVLLASPPLMSELAAVLTMPDTLDSPKPTESPSHASSVTQSTKKPSQLRIVTRNTKEALGSGRIDLGSARVDSPTESMSALSYVSKESPTIASRDVSPSSRPMGVKPGLPANPRSGVSRI